MDQIDEGIATLLLGEDESVTVHVPAAWLPQGTREGTVLRVRFGLDEAATQEGKTRVEGLLGELGNQP